MKKTKESTLYQEEKIYIKQENKLSEKNYETIRCAIGQNNAVGSASGYYDEQLSILHLSGFFLENLGYEYEDLIKVTKGSFLELVYEKDRNSFELQEFMDMEGMHECRLVTKDGTPAYVQMYKCESVDSTGVPIWILSVRMDWTGQNLALINEVIQSGSWYFDCDEEGRICNVVWGKRFRKMLGYKDETEFPNVLESWSELLHPDDKKDTLDRLKEAIADTSNQIKYDVKYRLRMR